MIDKITMAEVWEELTPNERDVLAKMVGAPEGAVAITKISTVLKAVIYRFYDKNQIDDGHTHATQIQQIQQHYEMEIKRQQIEMEREMRRRFQHEMQQITYTSNTSNPLNPLEYMRKNYGL